MSEEAILWAIDQIKEAAGISVRQAWNIVKQGDFPQPIALGPRTKRWLRSEVQAYFAGMPRVKPVEPPQLTAARAARAAGMPPAPAPFNGSVA